MKLVVNVEEISKDFSNLKKLNEIVDQLKRLTSDPVKSDDLHKKLQKIQEEIAKIDVSKAPTSGIGSFFGGGSSNSAEVSKLKSDNIRLQGDVERLQRQVTKLLTEKQSAPAAKPVTPSNSTPAAEQPMQQNEEQQAEEPKKRGFFSFGRRN